MVFIFQNIARKQFEISTKTKKKQSGMVYRCKTSVDGQLLMLSK